MKRLLVLIAASLLCCAASAQMKAATKQECNRRCVGMDPDNPKKAMHVQRLKQIRAEKQAQTDPARRKALAQAERDEIDSHDEQLENMCRTICRNNPEA